MDKLSFTLKLLFLKILKRIKLIDKFNFYLSKELNGKTIRIPFVNGTGLTNFVIKKDWLDSLIDAFVKGENKTFIDVGVNIGQTLIRLKTACPEVKYIGFEPNSTCSAYTQKLVKQNNFSNCIIQNAALSYRVENLMLEKTLVVDSRASVIASLRPDYFIDKEYVIALDYDSFYLNEDIGFVKIDVEGGEYEVIQGMAKAIEKCQPLITCEVLDSLNSEVMQFTQNRATLVCELLTSLNYGIIQLQTNNNEIISLKKINKIIIKQWTTESYSFNDYIFYPLNKESKVMERLKINC